MEELMQGVTVLSNEVITKFNLPLFLILAIVSLIGIVVGIKLANRKHFKIFSFLLVLISGITMMLSSAIADVLYPIATDKYTYKVTIDDSVSMIEFYNKYEVLSQDGLIFEIKER